MPHIPTPDQFLYSATQTAKMLGIHRSTVYRLIDAGDLKPIQTAVGRRFTRSELLRFSGEAEQVAAHAPASSAASNPLSGRW